MSRNIFFHWKSNILIVIVLNILLGFWIEKIYREKIFILLIWKGGLALTKLNKLYKLTLKNSRLIFYDSKHALKCKILLRIPPIPKYKIKKDMSGLTMLWNLRILLVYTCMRTKLNIKISSFIICIYICLISSKRHVKHFFDL